MDNTTTDKMEPNESIFQSDSMAMDYVDCRPFYPDEFFQTIVDYCKEGSLDLGMAVDVGCGPGMSTVGLTKHFKKVIGVDISKAQIALAPLDIPNCEFKVSPGQDMPFLADASVDLYAAGLALYLMPQKEAFAEADRVLKPGGTMATFGYGIARCTHPVMDEIIHYAMGTRACTILPDNLKAIANLWKDYERLPYPGWERREGATLRKRLTLAQIWKLLGFYQFVLISHGPKVEEDRRFTEEIKQLLAEKLPDVGLDHEFDIYWPTYILLGRKPL